MAARIRSHCGGLSRCLHIPLRHNSPKTGIKWDRLIAAWEARYEGDFCQLACWSAGIDVTTSRELVADGLLELPASLAEAVMNSDQLRIAARLAGALPIDLVRDILALARTFDWHEASALEDLAADCRRYIEERYAYHCPMSKARPRPGARAIRSKLDGMNPSTSSMSHAKWGPRFERSLSNRRRWMGWRSGAATMAQACSSQPFERAGDGRDNCRFARQSCLHE